MADMFHINTDLDGIVITVLHFLMYKYISAEAAGDRGEDLLKSKFKDLDTNEVNVKNLFRLEKMGRDQSIPMHDSFLDGGAVLIWCLAHNKLRLLTHFLSRKMVNFWRFGAVKTLLWACLAHKEKLENKMRALEATKIIFESPVMQNMFNEMPML